MLEIHWLSYTINIFISQSGIDRLTTTVFKWTHILKKFLIKTFLFIVRHKHSIIKNNKNQMKVLQFTSKKYVQISCTFVALKSNGFSSSYHFIRLNSKARIINDSESTNWRQNQFKRNKMIIKSCIHFIFVCS